MKILAAAALLAACAATASAAVPTGLEGPALSALVSVENGASFDGTVPRREGPLMILSEEKVLLRSRKLRGLSYDVYGSESGRLLYSHAEPPQTVRVWGTRQNVEIVDRKGYVRRQTARGAALGGLAGALLGVLLIALANPIGAALALAACACAGAKAGGDRGRNRPEFFSRIIHRRREVDS